MLKVYVAGKLNDSAVGYIKNMHVMITTANEIQRYGFSVFVPCLDILSGLVDGHFNYMDYFENNVPWMESADCVFVCRNYETSEGTKKEIAHAIERKIPVIYNIVELIAFKEMIERGIS
jgi:nucleoside 2-deoxyribosyltransferase